MTLVIDVNGGQVPLPQGGGGLTPTVTDLTVADQLLVGTAGPHAEKVIVNEFVNPGGGQATMRLHALAGQTGDLFRCEDSAGVAGCTVSPAGLLACVTALCVRASAQNAAPLAALGTEAITGVVGYVGSGATQSTLYVESKQASGASTGGSFSAFILNTLRGNSTESQGQYAAQLLALQAGTGAIASQYSLSLVYGADSSAPAVALGTVTNAYGLKVNFDSRGGTTSAFTTAAGIELDTPSTDGTHTVTTKYGLWIKNHGNTGITNATGIRIEAQSGASGTNVGIDNAATLLQRGNAGFFGVAAVGRQTITGALSTVADAPARAVLTSIITALGATRLGLCLDGTT